MQKHVHLIIALLWLLAAVLVPAFIALELDIAGVRAWTAMRPRRIHRHAWNRATEVQFGN